MVALLALAAAFGGTPGYQACCAAAAVAACPTELSASGPGSTITTEGSSPKLVGVWTLSCEGGARFDPAASQLTVARPTDGSVISPIAQSGAACFEASCVLPAALCLRHEGDRARVVACSDGAVATEALWLTTPVQDTRAAVVDKRVLVVRDAPPPPLRSAPLVSAAPTPAPPPAPASPVDLTIPEAPGVPCKPTAQRVESQAQVDDGNAAAMKGDHGYALSRYRAAIALNACNAFAWADMGETFLALKDAGRARTALAVATTLMPSHHVAWTHLGSSHEILGDLLAAADAYSKAVEAKPGFGPAAEGLVRVKPR